MLGSLAVILTGHLVATPTPVRLPADVDDVYALEVNPAGLGYLQGSELRLRYGQTGINSDFLSTRGMGLWSATSFGWLTLGGGLDLDVDDLDQTTWSYILGLGLRLGGLTLGLSWDRAHPPGDGPSLGKVNTGFNIRWASWLSTGLAIRDVGQNRGRRQWDVGLALRPWNRLVLSGRWRLIQGQNITDEPDLTALITVEPIQGVTVGLSGRHNTDFDFAMTAQLELTFGRMRVGASGQGLNETGTLVTELVYTSVERPAVVTPSRVAIVDMAGDLQPEPEVRLIPPGVNAAPYGGLPIVLDQLARTDRVKGVWVRVGELSSGWGRATEARTGLLQLKASGRRVDCLLSGSSDLSYYVASACDAILISPAHVMQLNGVAARILYLGEGLDRAGISAQVVRHGDYKSAPEQFTRSGMSKFQREALGAYLDDVYDTLVTSIADGRKLDRDAVVKTLDMGVQTATDAVALGLVDKVLYPDEVEGYLREVYQGRPWLTPAARALTPERTRWGRLPRIAVVHVDAAIAGGDSADLPLGLGRTVGAASLISVLDRLKRTPSVRAVVLRVDSPGGDALASDLIARAVAQLQAVKPVVASFGDVAASGGYYVAAGAGRIFAEPTSLTGSIGVYSLGFSFEQLLAKWGLRSSLVERGAQAGAGSPYADWTPEEQAAVQKVIDFYYRKFLETVAEGRKMKSDAVRAVAEGRIWSGKAAKDHGLVDELGGYIEALRYARREAGLPEGAPVELVVLPSTGGGIIDLIRTETATDLSFLPPELKHWAKMAAAHQGRNASASLPWVLNID